MTNDIRLWLYPGANPNSVPSLWGPYEVDVSAYVRRPGNDGGSPISYSWGKQDESTQTDAGQMTLSLDNRDGRFSTDKIDGPYYGLLDVNTPIRLGVAAVKETFTRTVTGAVGAAAGWGTIDSLSAWSNPSSGAGTTTYAVDGSKGTINMTAANQATIALINGGQGRDVDLTSSIIPAATATGTGQYGLGHVARYTDNSNYVYTTLEFNTAGDVSIRISRVYAGSLATLALIQPIPSSTYSAGVAWKLRTQMDGDTMRAKAWPAASSEPSAWMLTADDPDNSGSQVGVYSIRFGGNTNSGAYIGLDSMTVIGLEWTGYVVSWPIRWNTTGRNSWAPITAGGVLRRLRQGTNPVQSPLRRQLGATADVTGYWPMEEGSDADYFLGAGPSGIATASFSGVTPAGENTLPGGGQAPTISVAGGSIRAQVKGFNNGTGMAGMVLFKLPGSLPSVKTRLVRIRMSRGPATIWDWSIDSAGITTVDAMDSQFNVLGTASSGSGSGVDFAGSWQAMQLETDNTGGNTAWSWIYHQVGQAVYWAQTGTVTGGTNTNVSSIELTGPVGTAFAHIWLGRNTLPFVTDTFSLVSSGYAGETAGARFARACAESGLAYAIGGPSALVAGTEAMGPQREATTLAILQSCVDADYGVLTERGAGLEFIPRAARWNLTQSVALSVAAGQIGEIPEPTRDDQRLRNKWTISRTNGGSSSYQDDASVARNGTWEDSATLNVKDDSVLVNHAAWRVNIGVQLRLRWNTVAMNFARSPSLLATWRQRFYGWRLGITTGLLQVTGNDPDVVMEGYQATLDPDVWSVEMNCTDARVWTSAVTDDTGILGRVDMDAGQCTLTSALTSTTTGANMPVTTAAGYVKWDNTAGLWSGGVDLNVGGERITVNAVANGTNPAQTFTITARGVNGYAAAHAIGTAVSLWFPAVVAL